MEPLLSVLRMWRGGISASEFRPGLLLNTCDTDNVTLSVPVTIWKLLLPDGIRLPMGKPAQIV